MSIWQPKWYVTRRAHAYNYLKKMKFSLNWHQGVLLLFSPQTPFTPISWMNNSILLIGKSSEASEAHYALLGVEADS